MKVVAAVIFHQKKILLAQRSSGSMAGFWEFPGGKLEHGETETLALKRELDEELGMQVQLGDKLGEFTHEFPTGSLMLSIYIAFASSQQLEMREHQDVKWIPFKELAQFQLVPADIAVIPVLERWLLQNPQFL